MSTRINREQAELARANFSILRKEAQSILDMVIKDATQGSELGKTMSRYVLDAIIFVDHERYFLGQIQSRGFLSSCLTNISNLSYQDDDSSPGSSSEIKNEDLETGSIPCCRICLESDAEPGDQLISPCLCKGTQQFVHSSCLDHWRSVKEGFAFSHCTTCKAQFHLRVESYEDNSWCKVKFRVFVARGVFLLCGCTNSDCCNRWLCISDGQRWRL